MEKVYTHENKILVENAKNILELEGLHCELRNVYAAGGIGDLAPIEAWPELWVTREHKARALSLLSELKDETQANWTCAQCGEENEGSFAHCWQCQTPAN